MISANDTVRLRERIIAMRGAPEKTPDATIGIPVNAQGDLDNVLVVLNDIAAYSGRHTFEIILVVNNFPEDDPPDAVRVYESLGITVIARPSVRKKGEAVGFTARIQSVYAASTEAVLLFDADCRIPNAIALLDWYVEQMNAGADVAYTHVAYYDLRPHLSIRARMLTHHGSRWFKRVVLRIPTTRGSNYTVRRSITLQHYENGMLADEMNVGPTIRKAGGKVVYSGKKELHVLTSGRMFGGGWKKLMRYLVYRLRYNLRVLPAGSDASSRTGRENDPVRRYVNNRPVVDKDKQP